MRLLLLGIAIFCAMPKSVVAQTSKPPCTGVQLVVSPPQMTVQLGTPASLIATFRNCEAKVVELDEPLAFEAGFLRVQYEPPSSPNAWRDLQPPVLRELRSSKTISIRPQEAVAVIVPIYFGSGGWVLTDPGTYHFKVQYSVDARAIESDDTRVTVVEPLNRSELLFARGTISSDAGRFLYFRSGDNKTVTHLSLISQLAGHGSDWAIRIALLSIQFREFRDRNELSGICPQILETDEQLFGRTSDVGFAIDISLMAETCAFAQRDAKKAAMINDRLLARWPSN
jgi:hypothetical protein